MSIDLVCSRCKKSLRVPDEAAGKQARCPICQTLADVPLTAVEIVPAPPPFSFQANDENAYRSPAPFGAAAGESPFARPKNLGDDAAIRLLLPVGRSLWAIAAGYFGLFSLMILPAPFAIGLGLIAIHDIRKHPEKHGMGRAIFGLTMGVLCLVAFVALIVSAGR